jgi:myo-inositol-1(or 4)-monophosphatase
MQQHHDFPRLAAFAETLADAARAAILPHFRTDPGVENKAHRGFDPVTEADRGAERAMRALIEAAFPDHGIEGEEYGLKPGTSGYAWVLDPVDGTRAFIAGLPLWGTLIGLTFEGRPILGVLDQAYLGERFIGYHGGPATLTDRTGQTRPLRVRPLERLTDAVLATTDPAIFTPAEAGGFEHIRATARLTRYGCDCYAYGMLALGAIDMVIEAGLKPHDIVALIAIIEAAGGVVTDWRGGPAWQGGQVIAAGDPRPHAEALVSLRRSAA